MYQNYTVGYGGSCDVYDPPYSPWCSGDFYIERQFPGEAGLRQPKTARTATDFWRGCRNPRHNYPLLY